MSHQAQIVPPARQTRAEPATIAQRPRLAPGAPGAGRLLLRLQATHGNRAVLRMLDLAKAPVLLRCPGGGCGDACDEPPLLQRREGVDAAGPAVPTAIDDVLRGPGNPLDTWVRAEMESRFGRDFSEVRVHTDPPAAASARAVNALAYTVGSHIVFAAGQHAPHSPPGWRLLAHELAHVVQQSAGGAGIQAVPGGIAPADGTHERVAEAAAEAVLAGGRPARLGTAGGSIQRAPQAPPEAPPSVGMSVTLSGLFFNVPDTVTYRPGRKTPQLLAIALQRLLGRSYKPELVGEVEAALGKLKTERHGGFGDPKPAKLGEEIRQIFLGTDVALALIAMLKSRKLELQLTPEQEDLLALGMVNMHLWVDFVGSLKEADLPLPTWYTRDIFDREMAQHGAILRAYADQLAQARTGQGEGRLGIIQTMDQLMQALYQPAMVLEAVRLDTGLAANDKTSGVYGALWQLPPAKKGERPRVTTLPVRLRNVGAAVLFLGYLRTQPQLAKDAETDPNDRRELVTRYAGFTERLTFTGAAAGGDEQLRDQPATANAPAFPSTLSPIPALSPPLFDAAFGTDHRFKMEVQFPSVYEALGRYAFTWERVRIPDDKIGEPVDVTKLEGEAVSRGEVAAVRFSRATAYAQEDIRRVIDGMTSDIGPAGVGALQLIGANAILRYIGTGIRLALDILTMPANQQLIVFPSPGLYMVRAAMSQVREGTEAVVRAPSVAYYPVLARDPDEMAATGVTSMLTARENTQQRIKELEAKLGNENLGPEERKKLQEELDELRQSTAPLSERLRSLKKQAAEQVKAIRGGAEGDLKAAVKVQENIEKTMALRARRKLDDDTELLTARFVSDLGKTIPLTLEVVDKPPTKTKKARVYVSDTTTPKSGDETGTGKTRDDAIVDAVRTLLEGTEGYGRGRVALGLSGGVRTIRIAASMGSLLSESIENVATALLVAAVAAAPLTGGASLSFLVPLGLVGAIPSAYRVTQRLESGTFELDLETGLEIVNIAGSLIGLGRLGATSLRMMRVGKGLLLVGFGVDAAGGIMMSAQFVQQIEALSKLPPGERSAALLMLIGQTMLSSGVMVGGALAERAHQQRAEAQGGRLKGLAEEKPPGAPGPAKTPPSEPAATAKRISPTDTMFEKAQIDADIGRLGNMDPESAKRLRADEPMRTALVDSPLAASALKKCASSCFPPDATPDEVARLDRLLSRLVETGNYDQKGLKEYLYKRRENLTSAIAQIEGVKTAAHLNAWLDFYNKGRTAKKLPPQGDPTQLLEQRDRSHDAGVKGGRTQAQSDGLATAGFTNPFERRGRYGQGFDDVMQKGPNIDVGDAYIVEYKGGDAVLAEGQMEIDWVVGNIRRLYLEGGPAGEQMARTLAKALREGRLRGVAYSTPLVHGVPQATVKIKEWTYPKTPLVL